MAYGTDAWPNDGTASYRSKRSRDRLKLPTSPSSISRSDCPVITAQRGKVVDLCEVNNINLRIKSELGPNLEIRIFKGGYPKMEL